ncbi:stage II sporulation protein M [Methanobrevibacter sp.]
MNKITNFKNLVIESLKDNKKLIIATYLIFIIIFIGAWIFSADNINSIAPTLQNMSSTGSTTPVPGTSPIDLIIHNAGYGIIQYILSVFFAIPSIVSLVYTGINLGSLGPILALIAPHGAIQYIVYLIPHGIFEITGTVIQCDAGILLFIFVVKFIRAWISKETNGFSDAFDKTKKVLIQSIVLIVLATILMIIAAPIESYFSVPFSEFVAGLF